LGGGKSKAKTQTTILKSQRTEKPLLHPRKKRECEKLGLPKAANTRVRMQKLWSLEKPQTTAILTYQKDSRSLDLERTNIPTATFTKKVCYGTPPPSPQGQCTAVSDIHTKSKFEIALKFMDWVSSNLFQQSLLVSIKHATAHTVSFSTQKGTVMKCSAIGDSKDAHFCMTTMPNVANGFFSFSFLSHM